jgi:hypothetical protein
MASSAYEDILRLQVDSIAPSAPEQLACLDTLPDDMGRRVTSIILSFACQAQNDAAINAGRNAFNRIPQNWLATHLRQVVAETLDLTDEWEYRRLLELLSARMPDGFDHYLKIGLNSTVRDIADAAKDFEKGQALLGRRE